MKNLLDQMSAEFDTWLENYKQSDRTMTPQSADPESIAMKTRWLAVIEDYKSGPDGEAFTSIVEKIEQHAPELREAIGKMLYEGTFSEESIKQLLTDSLNSPQTSDNACLSCLGCLGCTYCAFCALCILSGVATAASAIATTTTATTATVSI